MEGAAVDGATLEGVVVELAGALVVGAGVEVRLWLVVGGAVVATGEGTAAVAGGAKGDGDGGDAGAPVVVTLVPVTGGAVVAVVGATMVAGAAVVLKGVLVDGTMAGGMASGVVPASRDIDSGAGAGAALVNAVRWLAGRESSALLAVTMPAANSRHTVKQVLQGHEPCWPGSSQLVANS